MAAKKKVAKAGKAANPYVTRIVNDEDLRQNLLDAYDSARGAYGRLNNNKNTSKQIFDDSKLHKEIASAAEHLRDATLALREAPKRPKPKSGGGGGLGKLLLLAVIGAVAAIALSEGLRKKLLDALFGAEEEFEYTASATASPPTPAPEPTPTS